MAMPHRTSSHSRALHHPSSSGASREHAVQQIDGVRVVAGEEMDNGVGVDAASVLMLLSRWRQQQGSARTTTTGLGVRGLGRVFECKTCGRRFPTFQALGGHRASHRRPKPYPYSGDSGLRRTRLLDEPRDGEYLPTAGPRLHGCPVCGLEFAVGQALGGHMRRHRDRPAAAGSECELRSGDANATSVGEADVGAGCAGGICLDLSLAPSENCAKCRNNAVLGNTVRGLGARKSLMLNCPL